MPQSKETPEQETEDADRMDRNREWRRENRAAIEAYAREVARDGLPLSRYRSF